MSLKTIRIVPTTEELNILREKLNSISDLEFENPQNNFLSNKNLIKKLPSINETIGNIIGNYLEINNEELKNKSKEEIINQLTQTINNLKNVISNNTYKIDNYDNLLYENNELKNELNLINQNYHNMNNEISENYLMNSFENKQRLISKNNNRMNLNSLNNLNSINESLTQNSNNQNYFIEKLKSENLELKNQTKKLNKEISELNKLITLNTMIKEEDEEKLMNSKYLKIYLIQFLNKNKNNNSEIKNYLNQIFNNQNENYTNYLIERINSLEFQNYSLLSQIEYYQKITLQTTDDLNEYIEIIDDIRNVLNCISDDIRLNDDFYVIRDTLNRKENVIYNQRDVILERKNEIERNDIIRKNEDIILCKDKINEIKLLDKSNINYEKSFQILNEKISIYESLRDLMNKYEDFINFIDKDGEYDIIFKSKDELLKYNNSLIENNILLRRIIEDLLKNNNNNNIDEEEMKKINQVINFDKSFSSFNEDLIFLLINKAKIIEKNLEND